jgi:hypothetical protein
MTWLAELMGVLFIQMIVIAWAGDNALAGQAGARATEHTFLPDIQKAGRVLLRLSVKEAGTTPPFVAGDFTRWMPVRMKRYGDEWRFTIQLSPGVYRLAFRSTAGQWFVPDSFPNRIEDQMGGWVAVLVVP